MWPRTPRSLALVIGDYKMFLQIKSYKRYQPLNNSPIPMLASPIDLREAAAPVDTAILLVALAALEVAEPELCEAVPAVEEAGEAAEAMEERSAR